MYLEDISGAFDRVFKVSLMAKLCSVGVAVAVALLVLRPVLIP